MISKAFGSSRCGQRSEVVIGLAKMVTKGENHHGGTTVAVTQRGRGSRGGDKATCYWTNDEDATWI